MPTTPATPAATTAKSWATCTRGHRHRSDRPSVVVLAVDTARRVLLVPLADRQEPTWTLPLEPVPAAQRTSSVAALCVARLLDVHPRSLQVLPTSYEEACELNGLRMHVAALDDAPPLPTRVDAGARAHWWAGRDEIEDTTLEAFLAETSDDFRTIAWA